MNKNEWDVKEKPKKLHGIRQRKTQCERTTVEPSGDRDERAGSSHESIKSNISKILHIYS